MWTFIFVSTWKDWEFWIKTTSNACPCVYFSGTWKILRRIDKFIFGINCIFTVWELRIISSEVLMSLSSIRRLNLWVKKTLQNPFFFLLRCQTVVAFLNLEKILRFFNRFSFVLKVFSIKTFAVWFWSRRNYSASRSTTQNNLQTVFENNFYGFRIVNENSWELSKNNQSSLLRFNFESLIFYLNIFNICENSQFRGENICFNLC